MLAAVLMLPILLLSACGGGETALQAPMEFRAALLEAGGCAFTAQMLVDVRDRVYDVTLRCVCESGGNAKLTVLAPESIAGVTAEYDGEKGLLSYDGVALELGTLRDGALAPVALPALLLELWSEAYLLAAGREDALLHVSYAPEDSALAAETWFDAENRPTYAEISLDGAVVAKITLTDFALNGGET